MSMDHVTTLYAILLGIILVAALGRHLWVFPRLVGPRRQHRLDITSSDVEWVARTGVHYIIVRSDNRVRVVSL